MAELKLSFIWGIRKKLWAEGDKLRAEGEKLRAEGDKLWAEGEKLWAEAVIEVYGNIKMEWILKSEKSDYQCKLETPNGVEIFEP